MVQAEVTQIDHRCVAFRSSANLFASFLMFCVAEQDFYIENPLPAFFSMQQYINSRQVTGVAGTQQCFRTCGAIIFFIILLLPTLNLCEVISLYRRLTIQE